MPNAKNIKHQKHYTQFKIQPIQYMGENNIGYLEGNIIKYVSRYKLKRGVKFQGLRAAPGRAIPTLGAEAHQQSQGGF